MPYRTPPGYLNIAQCAAMLGVNQATLFRWRQRHYGPPMTKFGARTFYRLESVEEWRRRQEKRA